MKRWILPLLCIMILFSGLTACADTTADDTPANESIADEIDWENIVLSSVLPAPQSNLMKVTRNDKTTLQTDIYEMSMNQFLEYIRLCEEAGFDVDSTRGGSTMFSARNQDGYALTLTYNKSDAKMSISLVRDANSDSSTTPGDNKNTDLNAEEIYGRCASAVFYIEIYDRSGTAISSGSGVFISSDGKALTNHHVVEDAYSAKVMTNDGKVYTVSGYYDAQAAIDMALIQVDGSGFPFLTMGDSTAIAAGQTVFAIGSPKGLDDTISQGIISNANRVLDGLSYIQMTAPISSGSSGGALINGQGLLIGLNTATYLDAQNLNLAVPIHLYKQLSAHTLHPFPVDGAAPEYTGATLSFNRSLSLTVGETGTVTISADPGNCTEDVTILWSCDDESIVTPAWDDWDDWDIKLFVTGKAAGTATITISLVVSDTDEILASKKLAVTVSAPQSIAEPSLSFNSSLSLSTGETGTVTISADPGDCTETVTLWWECSDESIVTVDWDDWDGWNIDLLATGKAAGTATITISLVTVDTEVILATRMLTVTVTTSPAHSGASLSFNTALNIAVGETGTVAISANAGNCTEVISIRWDCGDESIVTPVWDEWNGNNINLFVTGNAKGSATITISLVTDSGVILVRNTLTVNVSEMNRRELAFNKLRDWIIANANSTLEGKPSYDKYYQNGSWSSSYSLIWDAEENRIYVDLIETLATGKWFLSIYFTPSGEYSDAVILNDAFGGILQYAYADFNPGSPASISTGFSYVDGDEAYRSHASGLVGFMMFDCLDFTNSVFSTYIPGFSVADLGFTRMA